MKELKLSLLMRGIKERCVRCCISGLGQFSKQGLRILKKYCYVSETKQKVSEEARWLAEVNCTQGEFELLQSALWNKPMSSPILVLDHKAVDVLSFSDLVGERYIDSFVIDVSISKYIEESSSKGQDFTLYLPTEFFQLMQVQDKDFKLQKIKIKELHTYHCLIMCIKCWCWSSWRTTGASSMSTLLISSYISMIGLTLWYLQ